MSGHSKWSTIKRKKGAKDAARGRIFTRLIREISIAAREGGGDPDGNPRLRTAVEAAKAANMPNDNIDRAIKKGTGELGGDAIEEVVYEGYGPSGVAVLAEIATDNRNRTASEIRHIFTKHGGNLGAVGSVVWMFDPKGVISVERSRVEEDALLEAALEAGAEDVDTSGEEQFRVLTAAGDLHAVRGALEKHGIPVENAELERIPKSTKGLSEKEAEQFLKFYELLEEHPDVQRLFANFEIPDEVLERLSS
jgi:YebC/PmpR family DNA-binding regulatory protein